MLGENYSPLVGKTGGWYTWKTPGIEFLLDIEGGQQRGVIDTEKKFRETDLGYLISNSPQAKEKIREAFGIPDMPAPEIAEEIEKTNKTKRKRKSELELETEDTNNEYDIGDDL